MMIFEPPHVEAVFLFKRMKYRLLTKEQLENLHQEFAVFLASQEIDVKEWNQIKKEKPELVQKELELFSDLVWEDVLTKVKYLEHFSKQTINLFKCNEEEIKRIVIKVNKPIDLFDKNQFTWLLQNYNDNSVEILKGAKKYSKERNQEIFELIEQGAVISEGALFEKFTTLLSL